MLLRGELSSAGRTWITDFEEIFRTYRKPVFNFLLRMSGNYDKALDLTQDVFVNALRGWPGLRDRSRAKVWLFRIARNVALRGMQHERRYPTESLEAHSGTLRSDGANPEEETLQHERREAMQQALGSLPAGLRMVLLLRDGEELDYREIAQVLGCSEGTVASRLNRARQLLGRKIRRVR